MELRAITRRPGSELSGCELSFVERTPIDVAKATAQHAAYRTALTDAGVLVETLPPDDSHPDATFVEDCAVVFDEVAILARPGAESRRGEVPPVASALAACRELRPIRPPGTLDGGDVLVIDRTVFVGRSCRTSADGVAQLSTLIAPFGYRVLPVDVRGCLHLKTAVTALDAGTVLMNPEWIDASSFEDFRTLRVPPAEPFGSNTLRVHNRLLLSARFQRTRDLLAAHGFDGDVLDISELEKAEAGLTCLSILFRTG